MYKSKRACVAEDRFIRKCYLSLFHGSEGNFGWEILSDPSVIFFFDMRKDASQICLMFLCESEISNEVLNWLKTGKYDVLAFEGILSEEYFEAGNFFMFVLNKVRVWAGELIKIVTKKINFSNGLVWFHFMIIKYL